MKKKIIDTVTAVYLIGNTFGLMVYTLFFGYPSLEWALLEIGIMIGLMFANLGISRHEAH